MDKEVGIVIKNKKASFEFSFIETYVAGIQLFGTEIKSIRSSQASINEAYCVFVDEELFIKQMHISEYKEGTYNNHEVKRDRKLLLNRSELDELSYRLKDRGLTIIPLKLFINKAGIAKLEIALAKGKKSHDKREDIKTKDLQREEQRRFK